MLWAIHIPLYLQPIQFVVGRAPHQHDTPLLTLPYVASQQLYIYIFTTLITGYELVNILFIATVVVCKPTAGWRSAPA